MYDEFRPQKARGPITDAPMSAARLFKTIETARLRLRPLSADDQEELLLLDSDPEVRRYLDKPLAPSQEDLARALPRLLARYGAGDEPAFWAAEERASGTFIGWFHLRPAENDPAALELGYRLRRDAWGHGYATEGARAFLHRAFVELAAERVIAHALEANTASLRVLEKVGLRPHGRFLYRDEIPAVTYSLPRSGYIPDSTGP